MQSWRSYESRRQVRRLVGVPHPPANILLIKERDIILFSWSCLFLGGWCVAAPRHTRETRVLWICWISWQVLPVSCFTCLCKKDQVRYANRESPFWIDPSALCAHLFSCSTVLTLAVSPATSAAHPADAPHLPSHPCLEHVLVLQPLSG